MVSGKCLHPWNKTKKGTFQKGHKGNNNPNNIRTRFKKGRKLPLEVIELNKKLGKERYKQGNHPFKEANQFAHEHRRKTNWYGLGKCNWNRLSKQMKERDNWRCRECSCDLHRRKSNCHHIIPYEFSFDNSSNNLATVCIPCHRKVENEARKLIQIKLVAIKNSR